MPTLIAEKDPTTADIAFWESQFDGPENVIQDTPSYYCPPETEIYGRSLSTIRRLGALMIERPGAEIVGSPEAEQAKVEFYTSVIEGFGTDVELGCGLMVRDFDTRPVRNGKVMSKDLKTAISDMTEAGLACAEETAKGDARFLPQLTRSVLDHENALIVDQMVRGETDYNMRVVFSLFPEEGAAQSGDDYWQDIGYVPWLRRGFIQLYLATEDGLFSGSLSFDGSEIERAKELLSQYGIEVPDGEITDNMLKYAITGTATKDQAKAFAIWLADNAGDPRLTKITNTAEVTQRYGSVVDRAFCESYVHLCESLSRGKQTPGARALIHQLANNAHHFNERYTKALYGMRANANRFTNDDSIVLHELLVYSTIEMLRALHLREIDLERGYDTTHLSAEYLQAADASSFQNMLGGFGADGAQQNRIYSACGIKIKLGDNGLEDILDPLHLLSPQDVFGGQDKDKKADEDEWGPLKFKCTEGHSNERRRGERILVCRVKSCKEGSVGCGFVITQPRKPKEERLAWRIANRLMEARKSKRAKVEQAAGRQALELAA